MPRRSVRNPVAIIAACFLAGGVLPGFAASTSASASVSAESAVTPVRVGSAAVLVSEMSVPPDFLWAELKRMYVLAEKFRDQGFTVEQITDDPAAWLGGTIITKVDQGRVDRRIARFTAIDDTRRLLALEADYADGLSVLASYEVTPTAGGCTLRLVAHARSTERIEHSGELRQSDVQRHVRRLVADTEEGLRAEWQVQKQRIEALYRAAAPGKAAGK